MIKYQKLAVGKVVFVGVNETGNNHSTASERIELFVGDGIKGDKHAGLRKLSDVRNQMDIAQIGLPKGTEMFNTRQWSMVSVEEMDKVAKLLNIAEIPRGSMGENIRIEGIENLTQLPIGTHFGFMNPEGTERRGTVLFNIGENIPCVVIAKEVVEATKNQEIFPGFVKAAMGLRGLVGFVEVGGKVQVGDQVVALVPQQN